MIPRFLLPLAGLLLACTTPGAAAAPPPVPSLSVQGVLQTGDFFGPPGNGENPAGDRIDAVYYLQLPAPLSKQIHPTSILAEFSASALNASFIQLIVFDEEKSVARTLVGKRVRVIGTVLEPDPAPGATRRTPAQIQVKSLSGIRDWQW